MCWLRVCFSLKFSDHCSVKVYVVCRSQLIKENHMTLSDLDRFQLMYHQSANSPLPEWEKWIRPRHHGRNSWLMSVMLTSYAAWRTYWKLVRFTFDCFDTAISVIFYFVLLYHWRTDRLRAINRRTNDLVLSSVVSRDAVNASHCGVTSSVSADCRRRCIWRNGL